MSNAFGPTSYVKHFITAKSVNLLAFLSEELTSSRESADDLVQLGSVYVNKQRIVNDIDLRVEDYVRVHTHPKRYPRPEGFFDTVLFENDYFLIVDKPHGVPCHATVDNISENVISWWSAERGARLYITHRIDVPTAGALVLAKSSEATSRFNKLILKNRIRKEYILRVEGAFARTGLIEHWMEDIGRAPRKAHAIPQEGLLDCRLHIVEILETNPAHTIVRVQLETGRTHQIRAQFTEMGHPLVNDTMYGAATVYGHEDRIDLIASCVEFRCPFTGETIRAESRRRSFSPRP